MACSPSCSSKGTNSRATTPQRNAGKKAPPRPPAPAISSPQRQTRPWTARTQVFRRAVGAPPSPGRTSSTTSLSSGDLPDALAASVAVPPFEPPQSAFSRALHAYTTALRDHPTATKAVTSFLGFGIGDAIAQSIGAPFDLTRNIRMSLYGLIIDGPLGHK